MSYRHGILYLLRCRARTKDMTGEIGGILGAITRNKGAKLALIAHKDALLIGDAAVVGKDGRAWTAATLTGLSGSSVHLRGRGDAVGVSRTVGGGVGVARTVNRKKED